MIVRCDSERRRNLMRAAGLLRRLDDVYDGELAIEGTPAHEVVRDLMDTANEMALADMAERARPQPPVFSGPLQVIPGGAA